MGERLRKSGRRMEKSLWVRDVEKVGEVYRNPQRQCLRDADWAEVYDTRLLRYCVLLYCACVYARVCVRSRYGIIQ